MFLIQLLCIIHFLKNILSNQQALLPRIEEFDSIVDMNVLRSEDFQRRSHDRRTNFGKATRLSMIRSLNDNTASENHTTMPFSLGRYSEHL